MDFNTAAELLELCNREEKTISQVMMQREETDGKLSQEEMRIKMKECIHIMRDSSHSPIKQPVASIGGLIGGEAKKVMEASKQFSMLSGELLTKAMAYSMAVLETNASMGLVVAAPTAGSSGVVPGVLLAACETFHFDDEILLQGLFNAAAIGLLFVKNASVSGAEAGCQAEMGSAAAMASSALVQMLGGTPQQCLNASSIVISNMLGLICDPIAGLVECPCQSRNVIGVSAAVTAAQMSLADIHFPIPFDQMAATMKNVGVRLPYEFRETALGGCASTTKGQQITSCLFKNE